MESGDSGGILGGFPPLKRIITLLNCKRAIEGNTKYNNVQYMLQLKMNVLAVAAAFSGLSISFVALRLYTRFAVVHSAGKDDFAIMASLTFAISSFSMLALEVHYGVGKPKTTLSVEHIERQFLFLWLSIPLYNLSLTFTKASILLLYLRIFPIPRFVLASHIALGVISIYGLWCVLSAILNCVPVSAFWDLTIQGNCIPREFLWFFNASLNIVTDLVILIMPIPVLSRLHLPRRQKFGVIVVFAAGIFTCITSMIRLKYVATAIEATDTTESLAPIAGWSFVEMNMGIICSCLPSLHPLITRALPWLRFIPRYHVSWFHMPYSSHHSGQDSVALARRQDPKRSDRGITVTQELHLESLEQTY